jgi:hypothetical protein
MADRAEIDKLQLSRIYRRSLALGLDSDTQAELKAAIANGMTEIEADSEEFPATLGSKRCELKIRQLVRNDAPWSEMKTFAWQLFRLRGTSEGAGQLVICTVRFMRPWTYWRF